ncbi:RBBP9/YdeN family alpha/beta hydrolase [Yersinia ruckeri]|uniref:RBBP9/YdeN family alpha/beta hydrolase n=1 Tax=Yersinia ruckeri TaxID=29486 RepID=UPI001F291DEB|nr:alpha/beta hydrolase [Yersinia ruckeri]MCK8538444.1 alpha/beta hydrolase [Yersinia ruckeri]MCK8570190.1 alpha/beta hydrolase [Yersinia ruckeri]MCK8573727.1 alpha/beta hydrolase [Yersinia ruckeri]MCK8576508.1 alpha/beta hydrolase [Yersinia ruckeri]MCK8579918.1 alpha/beta hydrolase [Yersinia ruckeri]
MIQCTFMLVPGYTNSGPDHWQSFIERKYVNVVRVMQKDWDNPNRETWRDRLARSIDGIPSHLFLVGHGCGAISITQWAEHYRSDKVIGALLVAPADVDADCAPTAIQPQRPVPLAALPFSSTLICSNNDDYLSLARAQKFAACWGSELLIKSGAGHWHTDAGYGEWPEIEQMLERLSGFKLIKRQR